MALNEINSFNSLAWCLNLARLGKHSYNFERENIMDYIRGRERGEIPEASQKISSSQDKT